MPRVRLILEDDNGNPMPHTEQVYVLEGECDTINQIEAAVETFKKNALPPLEQALLTQAQERFVTEEKKSERSAKTEKISLRSAPSTGRSSLPSSASYAPMKRIATFWRRQIKTALVPDWKKWGCITSTV